MGARINYLFKDSEPAVGEPAAWVVLYSHWGETDWEESIAMALHHARPRWDDSSYATRMIISYLIQDSVLEETGFGIYATNPNDFMAWDPTVEIDLVNKQIDGHTFDEFINYHVGSLIKTKTEGVSV